MGIVFYEEPMDKRLEDEAFYEFFRVCFEEEHKDDAPVLDDQSWDLAIRDPEYVSRIYEKYMNKDAW